MRSDLVLDEDDKRKRFRKCHMSTIESRTEVIEIDTSTDEEDDSGESDIVQNFLPNKRVASVALNKNESQRISTKSSSLQSLRGFRKGITEDCPLTSKILILLRVYFWFP